ncbi:MAG: universal stress protein [Pseudomonadota bacterium]
MSIAGEGRQILACVDGSIYAQSVVAHAGWAARRLAAPVELLQVLGRREAVAEDRSGSIVAGARRRLLEQLATLDAERAKLLMQQARLDLDEASDTLSAAGVAQVDITLRHGDLLETIVEREPKARMTVIGKRGEAADFAKLHLGSNLERIVRAASRPVLIAARAFKPIETFLIAFDGRQSSMKAVEEVCGSELCAGLKGTLIHVGEPNVETQARIATAEAQLRAAGHAVETRLVAGLPEKAIPEAVSDLGVDLLVMGAYGHSRLRSLVIGSTTSEMIREARVPILVVR